MPKKATKAKKKRAVSKPVKVPTPVDPISLLTLEDVQKGGPPPYIDRLIPRSRLIIDLYFKYRNKPALLAKMISKRLQITIDKAIGLEVRYLHQLLAMIERDKG